MVNLTINGIPVQAKEGENLLEAAKTVGIKIPSLCYINLHNVNMVCKTGSCRVCLVEVEGRRNLAPACSTIVTEGMVVKTDTARVTKTRRTIVELLLSNHPSDCLVCKRSHHCELQQLAADMGIRGLKYQADIPKGIKDMSNYSIERNPEKCILCRRCETVCNQVQQMGVYSAIDRSFDTKLDTSFHRPMIEGVCTFCGQCVAVCPTAALTEVDNGRAVFKALQNPKKFCIAQTAPAVRVALGEEFDLPPGTEVTGKMVAALRRLGFDKVFDTDFAADLTIMEEGTELIGRLQNGGTVPMMTSCCPAWVKFLEHRYPEYLPNLSTCKSPHEMLGAILKHHYAPSIDKDVRDVVTVSIMPCLAKKFESNRPEMGKAGVQDVDFAVSTRELARMIREAGLDFASLPDEEFDSTMGESSGAAVIFGTTGGVMEAALRTAYEVLTKERLEKLDFHAVRGFEGLKEAEVVINGQTIRVAIAHGLGNAKQLMESIKSGEKQYHFVEVMACPGGCIGGGGQPYHHGEMERIQARAHAIYSADGAKTIRRSHENPEIIKLYQDFLGAPNSEKAHHLLHTHYQARNRQ